MKKTKRKSLLKGFAFRILYPLSQKYLSKERSFRYKDTTVRVFPGVFHPGFFFSTKFLLNFIEKLNFDKRFFLEIGAGSGLISIFAAKRGGIVTASDISITAVNNIQKNAGLNSVKIDVVHSDLFDRLPNRRYDYIIINPPYYKINPVNEKEFAWYGGDDLQYFRKLFSQLGNNAHENTNVIMVLSDEADLDMIKSIASEFKFSMKEVQHKRTWGENHFIFEIQSEENL
jgi:release factor glutamine methyltransferase